MLVTMGSPVASRTTRPQAQDAAKRGVLFIGYPRRLPSLPLDRSRWLRGHVVDDAIDAFDLVDDAGRNRAEKIHVERIEIGGHAVGRGDRAQANDEIVGAEI